MKAQTIEIKVDAMGRGSIVLDGKDISNTISGLNLRIRAGEVPRIFLVMNAAIHASVETTDDVTVTRK